MNWLLPSALAIGGAAAAVTLALHFIARSRPLAEPLPTVRFVPQTPVQARARSMALSDLLLLAMRVAAIVALTAGAAGPVLSSRGKVLRVIVADRSRSVGNAAEARDSARVYARAGDLLVVFDSAVDRSATTFDSIRATSARGSLSAAIAAAIRVAAREAARADSVDIVLVSPFSREEVDDATLKIRNTWPGRIRIVRVGALGAAIGPARIETVSSPNDAVAAGLSLTRVGPSAVAVRVVRSKVSAADSAWTHASGHVLVAWPESPAAAAWSRRATVDTIGGVVSLSGALVATFPRPWTLDGTAVARWADGEPAAVERSLGDGCVRDVGILIDGASDITLHAPFRAFVGALIAPCGGMHEPAVIDATLLASLAGPAGLAPAAALRDPATAVSNATPWLLALGALLLIVELAVRRETRRLA